MPILKRNGKTFSGTPTKVDTAKSYTTFDSADDKNPTTWSDVELLTSKEEQRSLFSKISTMFKNIRYLYKMLGTTDISQYSDGTVTGAVKAACDKADANEAAISEVNSNLQKIGTDVFTDYTFDTTKYKLLIITFFETSIVNSYVTVMIPSIIGTQQASIVMCGPVGDNNYVYNVVVKFQVKADGIEWVFAKFDLCSSSTITRDLCIDRLESIVGIKK